jgi:hypothetical protein
MLAFLRYMIRSREPSCHSVIIPSRGGEVNFDLIAVRSSFFYIRLDSLYKD